MNSYSYIVVAFLFFAMESHAQYHSFHYDPNGNQTTKIIEGTVSTAAIEGPETACIGDSVILTVMGGEAYLWSVGGSEETVAVAPETNTTYRVTVTDENGCTGVSTHSIEVLPQPEPFAIGGDLTGFTGSVPNTYTVEIATNNSAYFWSVEGGYIFSGFGTPEVQVIWQTDSIGYINVVEQNVAGCFGDTITLEIPIASRQVISLDAGWNLISTYLELEDNSPEAAFSDLGSNLLRVKNIQEVYNPNAPPVFNTLTEILPGQGYWVEVETATELAFFGRPVDPLTTPIHLSPGWNLIGYTWSDPQSVEFAFSSIEAGLVKVKDIFGSYDPNLPSDFNTLTVIEPGKGYWVNVSQATTLYFPDPDEDPMAPFLVEKRLTNPDFKYDPASGWQLVAHPNSTIAYGWTALNDEPLEGGAVIGAFVNDECRGLAKVAKTSDTSYVSLVINGEVSETVEFRTIHKGKLYISDHSVSTQPGSPFTYLLPIRFYDSEFVNTNEPPEGPLNFQVFPNPFSDKITLSLSLTQPSSVKIRILNQEGRVLKDIHNGWLREGGHTFFWSPEGSNLPTGVYLIHIQGEDFNEIKKITYQK